MDYNNFIFLVWWPDFAIVKKMGDFFGDSKRHLPERGRRGATHKKKKFTGAETKPFRMSLFKRKGRKLFLNFSVRFTSNASSFLFSSS